MAPLTQGVELIECTANGHCPLHLKRRLAKLKVSGNMAVHPSLNAQTAATHASGRSWISAIRRYIVFMAGANLVWEFAQLPLYTIWLTGTPEELAFAALHCTGGDILIALSTLMGALAIWAPADWPARGRIAVVMATVVLGLGYTIFSEWLNIEVRQAWAYRAWMPVIPIINTGLSPLLQWLIIPVAASVWAWRLPADAQMAQGSADA